MVVIISAFSVRLLSFILKQLGMGDTSTKISIPILHVLDTYKHRVLFLKNRILIPEIT